MSDDPDIAHPADAFRCARPAPVSDRKRTQGSRGVTRGQVLRVAGLIGALCWGAWITRAILDMRAAPAHVVKVQLASIVGNYVRAEARGDTPPDQIGPHMAQFMKVLDATIARHARRGQIVLVSEAVVGGGVPDITGEIAREVRATLPASQSAPAPPRLAVPATSDREAGNVEARMRDYLLHEGAPQ